VPGLTMGEIARLAKGGSQTISGMASDKLRDKGRLTVIPMRGWTRNMLWPDTELKWVTTSPMVPSFDAVVGYAMIGLGCEETPWVQLALPAGIRANNPIRGIGYPKKNPDEIIKAMEAYRIPGVRFVKHQGPTPDGKPGVGVYVEVTDWDRWNPTELSFYMHKQAARWSQLNPFAGLTAREQNKFKIHVGSNAWFAALQRDGARVDVPLFLKNWSERAAIYREQTRKFWLYPWGGSAGAAGGRK